MSRFPLATIEDKAAVGYCAGACCQNIDAPPFALVFDKSGVPNSFCETWPDYVIYRRLTAEQKSVYQSGRESRRGKVIDFTTKKGQQRPANEPPLAPCHWLVDGRCSDYENRPTICREFPSGEHHCKLVRDSGAKCVWPETKDEAMIYALNHRWRKPTWREKIAIAFRRFKSRMRYRIAGGKGKAALQVERPAE